MEPPGPADLVVSPAPAMCPDPTTAALPEDPRHIGELDRVRGITSREFFHEYYAKRKPVVLEGMMEDWPAMQRWSFDHFREEYGAEEVRVGRCFGETQKMELGPYINEMHDLDPEGRSAGLPPLYMEAGTTRNSGPSSRTTTQSRASSVRTGSRRSGSPSTLARSSTPS